MSSPPLKFVLKFESLQNAQLFSGNEYGSIKIGNNSVRISKDLAIFASISAYLHFRNTCDPYTVDISGFTEEDAARCAKKYISLSEGAEFCEIDQKEAQIMISIGEEMRSKGIKKQIESLTEDGWPKRVRWTSEFLSEFYFLPNCKEFCFDVCGKAFMCPKILAMLLSKEVCKRDMANSKNASFKITQPNGFDKKAYIEAFRSIFELLSGNPLTISAENVEIFAEIATKIGNEELLSAIESFDYGSINISNVYRYLNTLHIGDQSNRFNEAIEFAAAHFFQLSAESLLSVPAQTIKKVVSNPQLRIESEEQLFEFAKMYIKRNGENGIGVLSKVNFNHLDSKAVNDIIEMLNIDRMVKGVMTFITKIFREVHFEEENVYLKQNIGRGQNYIQFWKMISQKSNGMIIVPEGITRIGEGAFQDSISSVKLPSTLTEIGMCAFNGCSSLSSITIPPNVTQINDSAFSGCSSLSSIVIPSNVVQIGDHTFEGCSSLLSVTIPPNVIRISKSAFHGCSSLSSIAVPPYVTQICDWAFSICSSLTSIKIPSNVAEIGDSAFHGCSSLTSISIPPNVSQISQEIFYGCSSLSSIIIPPNVTKIGDWAFCGCSSLLSVTIPPSVGQIGESAFECCSSLISIEIPPYLTQIGNHDFDGCSSLSSITIPSNVTRIGNHAFRCCSSLSCLIFSPNVVQIDDFAFQHCSSLSSITIPPSVTQIGRSVFHGCSSLSSVTIPLSVTQIGRSAFQCCSSLSSITIPLSVSQIGYCAFAECSSLTSITIPPNITQIGDYAFHGCSSLSSIIIPRNCVIADSEYPSFDSNTKVIRY